MKHLATLRLNFWSNWLIFSKINKMKNFLFCENPFMKTEIVTGVK